MSTAPGQVPLQLPSLDDARRWLGEAPTPANDAVDRALAAQHPDGSWGASEDIRRRVLPTLWTASVLGELGEPPPAWASAVDFLARHATTDDGVFSRDGRRAGVLACYVAIAAAIFLRGERHDLAAPQVDWVLRYQDVRTRDAAPRGPLPVYHPGLASRYGGCLAGTSCLLGVVKAGRALSLWLESGSPATQADRADAVTMLGAVRDALLERRLLFRSDGELLPLGTPPTRAHEWLAPTFPLDWRTDLVEVLDLVARTGPADGRMQPALDHLARTQLPGGAWPLRRSFWPPGFTPLEPCSARRPSRLATRRVVAAVELLAPASKMPLRLD